MSEAAVYPGVYYNPLTPEFREDPYAHYKELREWDPVHWSAGGYCWVLTRHDHVKQVLAEKRCGIGLDRLQQIPALKETFAEPFNVIIRTQLLGSDPPDHTRIRGLAVKAFSTSRVEALRPKIQALADRLIDAHADTRSMDFMKDFAYPLPFIAICDILNVPEAERAPLEDFTHKLMRTTDPTPMTRAETDGANYAATGFRDYFMVLAAERRARPTDDLFSEMANAQSVITDEELFANMILIFCAGHDTVVNLFGNGLLALHRNPGELAKLKADRSLIKAAVEELLRYDASVQIARRTAFEPFELGGKQIAEGAYLLCCLGAANRDPAVFPDPDRLDVQRPGVKPMSFGGGLHYCLGATLARLEGEIVFNTILTRMPELQLATLRPTWHQNVFVRGLESLPVSW